MFAQLIPVKIMGHAELFLCGTVIYVFVRLRFMGGIVRCKGIVSMQKHISIYLMLIFCSNNQIVEESFESQTVPSNIHRQAEEFFMRIKSVVPGLLKPTLIKSLTLRLTNSAQKHRQIAGLTGLKSTMGQTRSLEQLEGFVEKTYLKTVHLFLVQTCFTFGSGLINRSLMLGSSWSGKAFHQVIKINWAIYLFVLGYNILSLYSVMIGLYLFVSTFLFSIDSLFFMIYN